ncbi:hypothetical protein [Bordetella genomosp. 5]|uniref:Lipoprotein n=1 Tax=Bordetella genomosp. 5 TaxID=1395608 RepID=A0A261T2J5_9BORD|nr:hypothetical protein [Bordetella genomosp. 5]OZI43844.1 hypothetical protein CAL25_23245 [Bordetella genomosp. 5]
MAHPVAAIMICLGLIACSVGAVVQANELSGFQAGGTHARYACAAQAAVAAPVSADGDEADVEDLIDAHYQLTAFGRRA